MANNHRRFTSVEICAGAGGQAIGLEMAKFEHLALVEIDPHACQTLRVGFEGSQVIEGDVREFLAAVKNAASDYADPHGRPFQHPARWGGLSYYGPA